MLSLSICVYITFRRNWGTDSGPQGSQNGHTGLYDKVGTCARLQLEACLWLLCAFPEQCPLPRYFLSCDAASWCPCYFRTPHARWSHPAQPLPLKMAGYAMGVSEQDVSVLQAHERLRSQQSPVLSNWDLLGSALYCQCCSWESSASVKLESMEQSPFRITDRQFYIRKCKELPRVRRKVHLITVLLPVIAKWGGLERSVKMEQACSHPSPEYSPKIQWFLAQGISKTVAVC